MTCADKTDRTLRYILIYTLTASLMLSVLYAGRLNVLDSSALWQGMNTGRQGSADSGDISAKPLRMQRTYAQVAALLSRCITVHHGDIVILRLRRDSLEAPLRLYKTGNALLTLLFLPGIITARQLRQMALFMHSRSLLISYIHNKDGSK